MRTRDGIGPNLLAALKLICAGDMSWPLFMYGKPGTGKTCAALYLLDHAGGLYFTPHTLSQDLLAASKEQLSTPGGRMITPRGLWSEIANCPLLILDELGTRGKVSDWVYDAVKRVLDEREGKPLVCVSNLDLDVMAKVYDDRVASRLAAGTIIEIEGADRRLQ